jgi:hypothetical protein
LKEAALRANGLTLGQVGGRIVGEVIIGLLELNRNSYLSRAPLWKPTLPTSNGPVSGDFRSKSTASGQVSDRLEAWGRP